MFCTTFRLMTVFPVEPGSSDSISGHPAPVPEESLGISGIAFLWIECLTCYQPLVYKEKNLNFVVFDRRQNQAATC